MLHQRRPFRILSASRWFPAMVPFGLLHIARPCYGAIALVGGAAALNGARPLVCCTQLAALPAAGRLLWWPPLLRHLPTCSRQPQHRTPALCVLGMRSPETGRQRTSCHQDAGSLDEAAGAAGALQHQRRLGADRHEARRRRSVASGCKNVGVCAWQSSCRDGNHGRKSSCNFAHLKQD